MANTKGKVNPSVDKIHRPDLAQSSGNWYDQSRDHIKGPAGQPNPVGNVATKKDSAR